tara:strand:+ start:34 stop:945 length:912 start_codon:yes stop_codon:yes gene_type:complete
VALFCYRINTLIIICIIFFSCYNEENIESKEINDFAYNNIAAFRADCSNSNYTLSVYLEFLDILDNIDSITGRVKTNDMIYYEFEMTNQDLNSKVYTYEGNILDEYSNSFLPQDIFLYDLEVLITFTDQSIYTINENLIIPVSPNIVEIDIPSSFQLDETEWSNLGLRVIVKDLNNVDNIDKVKYEIKRTLLNGCDVECVIDDDCDQDIIEEDYISDQTWIFNYTESLSDTIFIYDKEILIRPIDGSGLPYNGECNDQNNDQICDGFEETDCGRTGIVEFKIIVIDKDGLKDEVDAILMEITE